MKGKSTKATHKKTDAVWSHLQSKLRKLSLQKQRESRRVVTRDWMWVLGLQREVAMRYKISVNLEGMNVKVLLYNMLTTAHKKVLQF